MKISTRPATCHLGSLDSCQYDYLCSVFLDFRYFLHRALGCEPKINNNGASFFSVSVRQAHISSCLFFEFFLRCCCWCFVVKDEREFIGTCWGTQSIFSALADCVEHVLMFLHCRWVFVTCRHDANVFFGFDFWRNVLAKIFLRKKRAESGSNGGEGGESKFNSHFNHRWAVFVEPRPDRST